MHVSFAQNNFYSSRWPSLLNNNNKLIYPVSSPSTQKEEIDVDIGLTNGPLYLFTSFHTARAKLTCSMVKARSHSWLLFCHITGSQSGPNRRHSNVVPTSQHNKLIITLGLQSPSHTTQGEELFRAVPKAVCFLHPESQRSCVRKTPMWDHQMVLPYHIIMSNTILPLPGRSLCLGPCTCQETQVNWSPCHMSSKRCLSLSPTDDHWWCKKWRDHPPESSPDSCSSSSNPYRALWISNSTHTMCVMMEDCNNNHRPFILLSQRSACNLLRLTFLPQRRWTNTRSRGHFLSLRTMSWSPTLKVLVSPSLHCGPIADLRS